MFIWRCKNQYCFAKLFNSWNSISLRTQAGSVREGWVAITCLAIWSHYVSCSIKHLLVSCYAFLTPSNLLWCLHRGFKKHTHSRISLSFWRLHKRATSFNEWIIRKLLHKHSPSEAWGLFRVAKYSLMACLTSFRMIERFISLFPSILCKESNNGGPWLRRIAGSFGTMPLRVTWFYRMKIFFFIEWKYF